MDGWRRRKGDNYNQEAARTRSYSKKPPLGGSWQPTVPSWEKKFCTLVGSVSWRKILESKKFMHLYDNVLKWDDSAGKEAFCNAKNRFFAEIHDLPCNMSMPDPDIYIDEIDWYSKIDPELILDLEREPLVPEGDENNEKVVIFGDSLLPNEAFLCNGWGETEEELKRATFTSSDHNDNPLQHDCGQSNGPVKGNGWGDFGNNSWCWNEGNGAVGDIGWGDGWNNNNGAVKGNGWGEGWDNNNGAVQGNGWGDFGNNSWSWNEGNGAVGEIGWGDGWTNNNSWGWNQYENNNYKSENLKDAGTDGVGGTWDVNYGKREGTGGRYMSRYKNSRFHGDDHQRSHAWRNGKGKKKANFVSEQPITDKRPISKQWKSISTCGPVSHHASGKAGQAWSWEKQVS